MKLSKIEQVNEFLAIVDSCKGDVTLRSVDGDIFNLKSKLSQYNCHCCFALVSMVMNLSYSAQTALMRENSCIS